MRTRPWNRRDVWGSDWPHPSEQSKHLPDDAVVENPATLYDFPKE